MLGSSLGQIRGLTTTEVDVQTVNQRVLTTWYYRARANTTA